MSSVNATNNLNSTGRNALTAARSTFAEVGLDIQTTSSGAAPLKTGVLEKNHINTEYRKDSWKSTIWFRAFNQGFDYATWTHEATYNLGPLSQMKAGGNSKFAGHVPVGRKYLQRTVDQGRGAYISHISETITDAISK